MFGQFGTIRQCCHSNGKRKERHIDPRCSSCSLLLFILAFILLASLQSAPRLNNTSHRFILFANQISNQSLMTPILQTSFHCVTTPTVTLSIILLQQLEIKLNLPQSPISFSTEMQLTFEGLQIWFRWPPAAGSGRRPRPSVDAETRVSLSEI